MDPHRAVHLCLGDPRLDADRESLHDLGRVISNHVHADQLVSVGIDHHLHERPDGRPADRVPHGAERRRVKVEVLVLLERLLLSQALHDHSIHADSQGSLWELARKAGATNLSGR